MFFLGMLSLLQVTFLPGAIILKLFNLKLTAVPKMVYSFGLSLVANYLLVLALVMAGMYNFSSVMIVFACEAALFTYLYCGILFRADILSLLREKESSLYKAVAGRERTYVFMIALGTILAVMFAFNCGTVFTSWDAVVSWNRWALDFFNGTYPTKTWQYPQLLPANWSLTYVFMGAPLQFFAKCMMPLFTILLVMFVIDFGLKHASEYFRGIVLYLLVIGAGQFQRLIPEGYAEFPVIFFSTVAIVTLLAHFEKGDDRRLVFIGMIFACGAAAVKQAGLFTVLAYLVLYLYYSVKTKVPAREVAIALPVFVLVLAVVVSPSYAISYHKISQGTETSNIAMLTQGMFQGMTYWQRFVKSLGLVATLVKPGYFFTAVVALSVVSVLKKEFRPVFLVFAAPYFLIWSLFYSYDIRNISIALPFICVGAAAGAEYIFSAIKSALPSGRKFMIKTYHLVAVLLVLIAAAGFVLTGNVLVQRHTTQERRMGDRELNLLLYAYYNRNGLNGRILTSYQFVGRLPDLGKYYRLFQFEKKGGDASALRALIDSGRIRYLLVPDRAADVYQDEIDAGLGKGELEQIFHERNYRFIEIKREISAKIKGAAR